jgi:hypothetical protein
MPRGGARPGSGRPKKPTAEKLLDGNPGKRPIKVIEFVEANLPVEALDPDLTAPDFLKLASKEAANKYPTADVIFAQVAQWLQGTGCSHLISPTLIEDFAINRRAFFECEYMNKKHGRIAKGKRSPYVDMAVQYATLMRTAWDRIWAIVMQNTEKLYGSARHNGEDVLEILLSGGNYENNTKV